ncbi:hypothetical protein [Curtobacterium sp. MCJR17_043]|uniref:hypothetical protein n=1 Tax=Curtobacterium sp. MCJR17_043 TaxID=2175660 RepID=UPI0024DFF14E|nr:hypothetical protein [Curtobacterium sp. MCJR17_043]WIB36578.1 hypothetical protein DEJ15_05550 [Curtobacterium sp. MCJR17_043]
MRACTASVARRPTTVRSNGGSGTIRQQASAQLWRLADPSDLVGEPLSHRAPEIGAEVARVVGLNRDQFLQTVVLPQGGVREVPPRSR